MPARAQILLVEDTPELREDLALELNDAGYAVMQAGDGETALAKIDKHQPDLIICDIQLPDIDGMSVLASIRGRNDEISKTPVIVVSAFSDSELRNQAAVFGIERFIVKPVDFADLLRLIEYTLKKNDCIPE